MRVFLLCLTSFGLFSTDAQATEDSGGSDWDRSPILEPLIGGRIYSSGSDTYYGINLGVAAGFAYEQDRGGPHLEGLTRAQAIATLGSLHGLDFRIGSFMGPWLGPIGYETGPDVFWNQTGFGDYEIPSTVGVTWQNHVYLDLKVLQLTLGADPDFFLSGDRMHVDWDTEDVGGFGHEMSYLVAARVLLLHGSYTQRITYYGTEHLFSVGIGL